MVQLTSTIKRKFSLNAWFLHPVLKMLAVMDNQSAGTSQSASDAPRTPGTSAQNEEFLQTGRTGRRNALPDILSENALVVTSSDLPGKMEGLTTKDNATDDPKDKPSASKS